jgi:hypothetical protein
MDQADSDPGQKPKGGWRGNLKIIVGTVAYMIPLFWLWSRDDYPDSLGIHITAHGKAGVIENWWYSYLLIERRHVLDIVLFLYMWAPLLAVIGYFAWPALRKLTAGNFSIHADRRDDGPVT